MTRDTTDLDQFKALFLLAGIPVTNTHELPNGYWPDNVYYGEIRGRHPWYLVVTPYGLIKIGWRKRVLQISWTDTPARLLVTEDDVTKDPDLVHAWTTEKALEYLTALRKSLVVWAKAERIASIELCEVEGNVPFQLPQGVTEEMVEQCKARRPA